MEVCSEAAAQVPRLAAAAAALGLQAGATGQAGVDRARLCTCPHAARAAQQAAKALLPPAKHHAHRRAHRLLQPS